jgi:phosphoribosylglycinamide formyltransferase-1
MTLKLAVLVSGGGRTFINLLAEMAAGHLDCEIQVLISSRRSTPALDAAATKNIPAHFISWKTLGVEEASEQAFKLCEGADYIVTAGFLKYIKIPPGWEKRIINIHPSLLPRHGGHGFFGDRVHQAVLASGDKVSGCTVHYVDEVYDHGDIIEQIEVPVQKSDDYESLAARVFVQEKILLPRVLQGLATAD